MNENPYTRTGLDKLSEANARMLRENTARREAPDWEWPGPRPLFIDKVVFWTSLAAALILLITGQL